jgi:ribosomal protein L29
MCMTERKRTLVFLASLALGASAMQAGAQEIVQDLERAVRKLGDAQLYPQYLVVQENPPLPTSDYWIGVQMANPWLPEQTKAQLGLEHGLMVQEAMEDSPAAKAGLKQFDILLKAGETPLKEPADLIKAVDAAKEGTLSLTVFRGGKEQQIDVTPVKRAEVRPSDDLYSLRLTDALRAAPRPELHENIKRLEEALNELKAKSGEAGAEIVFARPAIVAAEHYLKSTPFPKDLSLRITKQGDQPARVYVKRGDIEQEVSEDKLGELPEELRGHVQRFLGRESKAWGLAIAPPSASHQLAVPHTIVRPDGKVEGRIEVRTRPNPRAAPRPPVPPTPPAAPSPPKAPGESSRTSEELLQAILKKLDETRGGSIDELHREVQQLRKDLDELRAEKE